MSYQNATMRQTAEGETVGPKMHSAVKIIGKHGPEPSKKQLAESVGPNGSLGNGYRIVNRCLRKDLLKVHPGHNDANPHGRGAVVLTDKGAQYLSRHTDQDHDTDEYVSSDATWSRVTDDWELL